MDFLHNIEKQLDMTIAEKTEVMRELKAHFDELYDGFVASGMGAAQAQSEAEKRMGSPADIAARLNAAHNTASWRSALLTIVPFGASVLYLAACAIGLVSSIKIALIVAIGVVMVGASARELIAGRRPLWLTTWLAAGLLCGMAVLNSLGRFVPQLTGMRANAAGVLALALISLVLSLLQRRRMIPIIITGGLGALCAVHVLLGPANPDLLQWSPVVTMWLCKIGLLVLFARLVFQDHRYGSGTQATLFLLALLVLKFSAPTDALAGYKETAAAALCGLTIWWFTRARQRAGKTRAAFWTLFLWAASWQHTDGWGIVALTLIGLGVEALVTATVCELIILWPMRAENTERNRLTPAQ